MFPSKVRAFAPLPGTTPLPRGIFVDRWGTLLETPERGYAEHPDEVRFFPGALPALFRAIRAGWSVYLLGNEDAVARGELELEAWKAVEECILFTLEGAGVVVARQYACLDHPEGIEGRRSDSVYLLPNTGAFYHASHVDGVELEKSWVVGDSTIELVAGWRAGLRLAAVQTGVGLRDRTYMIEPEIVGADLSSVIGMLLGTRDAVSA